MSFAPRRYLIAVVCASALWGQEFDARERRSADALASKGMRLAAGHGIPKVFRQENQALSAPSPQDSEVISREFLRSHSAIFPFTSAEIDALRLVRKDVTPEAAFVSSSCPVTIQP